MDVIFEVEDWFIDEVMLDLEDIQKLHQVNQLLCLYLLLFP